MRGRLGNGHRRRRRGGRRRRRGRRPRLPRSLAARGSARSRRPVDRRTAVAKVEERAPARARAAGQGGARLGGACAAPSGRRASWCGGAVPRGRPSAADGGAGGARRGRRGARRLRGPAGAAARRAGHGARRGGAGAARAAARPASAGGRTARRTGSRSARAVAASAWSAARRPARLRETAELVAGGRDRPRARDGRGRHREDAPRRRARQRMPNSRCSTAAATRRSCSRRPLDRDARRGSRQPERSRSSSPARRAGRRCRRFATACPILWLSAAGEPRPAPPAVRRRVGSFAVWRRIGPVLVIVDDLHWADRSSLLLARQVVREPRLGPVLMSARSATPSSSRPPLPSCCEARARPRCRACPGRHGRAGGRAADRGRRGGRAGRARHPSRDGGAPFFVEQLVRHLEEGGEAPVDGSAYPRAARRHRRPRRPAARARGGVLAWRR